jgi:hypothetical protein
MRKGGGKGDSARGHRGSALLLAIFVLVLLAGMGIVLLSLNRSETKTSEADFDLDPPALRAVHDGDDVVARADDPSGAGTIRFGGEVDRRWLDCSDLLAIAERVEALADDVCTGTGCSMTDATGWAGGAVPTTSATSVHFVDGDLSVPDGYHGHGLLWVTGRLVVGASASWSGEIVAVGKGELIRDGTGGDGVLSVATVVANTLGPDGAYGTADDCEGGFGSAAYPGAGAETCDVLAAGD